MTHKIAVIVGSLRKESFTRKMAKAFAKVTPGLEFEFIDIGALELYNEDVEAAGATPAWSAFRDKMRGVDGVLFATPEYNRSVPGALKNVIDVGSRPYGKSVYDGKPAAVISVTPGGLGAFGANHHLRQSLVFLNMPTLSHEAYLSGVGKMFDDKGELTDESTKKFLATLGERFTAWVGSHAKAKVAA
jgi:chromate reductase, NAD(P)H dehydrogenase (quinone)